VVAILADETTLAADETIEMTEVAVHFAAEDGVARPEEIEII
jgi:hypothetical protein